MHSLSTSRRQSWLSWFLRGTLAIGFLVLASKLFEIQIIKGSYYRTLSEENRIRHIPLPARRGVIMARGGEILVGNKEIKKRIIFDNAGKFSFTDNIQDAPGEELVTDYVRTYPMKEKFAHASGYVGVVNTDEVGKIDPECPEKGPRGTEALVGKNGLELQYECLLSGRPGEELVEVNTKGEKIRSLGRREPVPGQDVTLTIDFNLQNTVADEMSGKKGAAIVTDRKGALLAFYSEPSYDPNILVEHTDSQKISELFKSSDLPFFNRVIGGTFHPGSVYKPLTALAALEEGVIDKHYTYDDKGVIEVNGFSYSNWYFSEYGRTEGSVDITRALARSTDTFFYKVGEKLGPDSIAKWSQKFGLDKKTGVDIPGEVSGLIPTPEWKKKVKKESWFLGNTYHMSIGQGDVSLTPIEVNTYIAAIANEGNLCAPHTGPLGSTKCTSTGANEENMAVVKEGMRKACQDGGTAYTFFDFASLHGGIEVACKTGTAEVGTGGDPHAWFTIFAPLKEPDIVATILVEKGGQGSSVAGPIARKIMDYYFAGARTSSQSPNVGR